MDNERPKTIPEIRGATEIPRDRQHKYSPASYAAQYGITIEDAEYLVDQCSSHPEVERRIHAMFAEDSELKDRVLNWYQREHEQMEERHRQIDKEREEARQAKIAKAKRQEAEREKARKALAEKTKKEKAEKEKVKS